MNGSNKATKVFIEKYLRDFGKKSTVYNAIVEAVTNSIDSIESKRQFEENHKGNIRIEITRNGQLSLGEEKETSSNIERIEISDDGVGFTEENKNSFNTLYSPHKQNNGGKGLGRMFYIKYFRDVKVESTYYENGLKTRSFRFGREYDIVENEQIEDSDGNMPTGAKVTLSGYCGAAKSFSDSVETFAHRILEKILSYLVQDDYSCPTISVIDGEQEIVLNEQIGDAPNSKISLIGSGEITIPNNKNQEKFEYKVFKLRGVYSQVSRIMLTANNKVVTDTKLEDYIPEFAEDFVEHIDNRDQKYILRYYVYGTYLDECVNNERTDFYFFENPTLEYPIGRRDIESAISEQAKIKMKNEVKTRFEKKKEAFAEYAEKNVWYKDYLNKVDFETIKINPKESDIEAELHRVKYETDLGRQNKAENILNSLDIKGENFAQKVEEITGELSATDSSNLAQYMVSRKVALELFEKAMQWNSKKEYEKEKLLHNIIFPTKRDSINTVIEEHNLWIIDESLNFTKYLSSDMKNFNKSNDRPDIAAFHYPVSYRGGDEPGSPITIFEFKRPGRKDFVSSSNIEDPIEQIVRYVRQFKNEGIKQPNGLNIDVAKSTPFYGYIVASADSDVKNWLIEEKNMTMMPDGSGWFLDRDKINLRIEFLTWEKLLKDAKIRHKIFFEKLGLKV